MKRNRMYLWLVACLLSASIAKAKVNSTTPIMLRTALMYGNNLGLGSNNANFYYGQVRGGMGLSIGMAIPISKRLYLGVNIDAYEQESDKELVAQQVNAKYSDLQHYADMGDVEGVPNIAVYQIAPECSYLIPTKLIDLMPSVKGGLLVYGGAPDIMDVRREEQGTTYVEQINLVRTGRQYHPFVSVGLKLNKSLSRYFDITTGVYYALAPNMRVGYEEKITSTKIKGGQNTITEYRQPFSSIQIQLGVQFRAYKGGSK